MNLEVLKDVRKSRKISIKELALSTGISADRISLIERGRCNPLFDNVVSIVKELGLELRIVL